MDGLRTGINGVSLGYQENKARTAGQRQIKQAREPKTSAFCYDFSPVCGEDTGGPLPLSPAGRGIRAGNPHSHPSCLVGCSHLADVALTQVHTHTHPRYWERVVSETNNMNNYLLCAKQQDHFSTPQSCPSNLIKREISPSYISLMPSFYSHFAKQINQQIACFNELKLNSGC